jgi:TnpA family transposase
MLTLAPLRWVKKYIFVSYKMTLFFSAVMISSDLDSETDLDILLERKQTSQEEDDFYDFYE